MSELHLDQDEIVHTDDDGLAFSRADYPAADYPADSRVRLAGHAQDPEGVVVAPSVAHKAPAVADPAEWVPVRWDHAEEGTLGFWAPVRTLRRVR